MTKLLSVTEYAHLYGKDPGNLRRLLASGRLNGQKVGKQWIIPADAAYPKDERETTGQYRNWRKKVALYQNSELMKTLSHLIADLRSLYGSILCEVILYGSYANGTQTDESDVDIALLLSEKPSHKTTQAMCDCVAASELECGKVLSVIDIDSGKYKQWVHALPFYQNIRKEGIVLWKTTI